MHVYVVDGHHQGQYGQRARQHELGGQTGLDAGFVAVLEAVGRDGFCLLLLQAQVHGFT